MTIVEFEVCFHALSKYPTASIFIEFGRIQNFIKDLTNYYQLVIAQLVVLRGSFQRVVEDA